MCDVFDVSDVAIGDAPLVSVVERKMLQLPVPLSLSGPAVNEWVQQKRQNVRPWSTFINTANFKTPASLPRLTKRILANIEYFKSNYLFVYVGLVIYCLITSPLLLIAVAVSAGAGYMLTLRHKDGKRLAVLGKEVPLGQQYGIVALFSLPLFYWVGAGAALFWVLEVATCKAFITFIFLTGASFFLIGLHAAFYNIDAVLASQDDRFELEVV